MFMASFTDLPLDILPVIFDKIGTFNILHSVQFVCKEWYALAKDSQTWRRIYGPNLRLKDIKVAIDRSNGGLIEYDVSGVYLAVKDMEYILHQSPQLEMLTYQCSDWFDPFLKDVFTKASISCPSLKNIGIYGHDFYPDDIEYVAGLFPNLEKFRLERVSNFGCVSSIARKMGELFELQLKMFNIVDDDFRAILDGCPKLQFLGVVTKTDPRCLLLDGDLKQRLKRLQGCVIFNLFDDNVDAFFKHGRNKDWKYEIFFGRKKIVRAEEEIKLKNF